MKEYFVITNDLKIEYLGYLTEKDAEYNGRKHKLLLTRKEIQSLQKEFTSKLY